MATTAFAAGTTGRGFMADQAFFTRFALFVALFIVFGFAQFAMRGLAGYATAPLLVHLHGGIMLAWLGMYVVQSWLVSQGQVAVHRKTGWLSLGIATAVVVLGSYTGINAIVTRRVPPFFDAAYFLALTQLGVIVFGAVVAYAVVKRRDVQWHRRLMVGSGILIMEPALGRLLPIPLTGRTVGELMAYVIQLGLVIVIARHDRKILGSVHPATLVVGGALTLHHLGLELLARAPFWQRLADSIAAG